MSIAARTNLFGKPLGHDEQCGCSECHAADRFKFMLAENARLTADNAALRADAERYRAGLKYYADMNHAVFNDDAAWDTVHGEPANFWCDEAGTATVEDGTIAKLILQGWALPDDPDNEGMIPPEFIDSDRAKESGGG